MVLAEFTTSHTKEDDARGKSRSPPPAGAETHHVDYVYRVNKDPALQEIVQDARLANEAEHQMSLLQGLRMYPKAIAWSIAFSTAVIMEGYDTNLLASFYALPQFNAKYGTCNAQGECQLSAAWQSGLSQGVTVGEILGLFANGYLSDRFGYRTMMLCSLFSAVAFIFIVFFAPNVQALEAGEILCGIPWGIFQTITTTYAADVCLVVLRCYLTTYVNLCWAVGQLISSAVLRGLLNRTDQWAYRVPFAIQWVWPVPIAVAVLLAPESPWWLVRNGRLDEAKDVVKRLTSGADDATNDKTVAMMLHTNEAEKTITAEYTYWDCFKGTNLRRTEIACLVWGIQNVCGSSFMGYSTYFYEQTGLSTSYAFDFSIGQYSLGLIGTILSWFAMIYVGRRTLYVGGLSVLTCILFVIGFISLAPRGVNGAQFATGSMLLVYTFVYYLTVGPVCYSLVSEIPSTRLRIKTVVLARNLYNICSIWSGVLTSYMLNPTAFHWAGKAGFFWGGWCLASLVWSYFRLPEPKDRTYQELNLLFEHRVAARNFKTTEVDPFGGPSVAVTNHANETKQT